MPVTLACHAMATRFEIILEGGDPVSLRAAGEEALEEVERLEARLSLFRETSEIATVNALASRRSVRVSPEVFGLLRLARQLHEETGGAFDITVAPLMRCWGFQGGKGHLPAPDALASALECVGMRHVSLDEKELTVAFDRPGVMLDLGAIGKGYAIERAVEILREAGVSRALIHGGTSTVYGLGHREDGTAWRVAIDRPPSLGGPLEAPESGRHAGSEGPLAVLDLKDEAISMSGLDQKFFEMGGRTYGHIIDPRSGQPAAETLVAVVVLPSATETDALSTALLVEGVAGLEAVVQLRPQMRALVAGLETGGTGVRIKRFPLSEQKAV